MADIKNNNDALSMNTINNQKHVFPVPNPAREKTKRPQLSCNPCRARKVKCDRIQPCTACSLHQVAEICRYDLSEAERQPILQAEALKEKDKAIALLRNEIAILRGEPIKSEPTDDAFLGPTSQKLRLPSKGSKKNAPLDQKPRFQNREISDSIYFSNPGVTNVVDEFSLLSFDRSTASHGSDISSFPMATSHPFPTLWSAGDDTLTLVKLLPPEQDLFFYLDAFQRRAHLSSFPYVPEECSNNEVRIFLDNLEQNAAVHPDMLALLFSTLAQGLQDGVYDRCGEKWVSGSLEAESKKGDVYIAAAMQCLRLACFMNRPTLLSIQALVMMGPYLTNNGKFLDASALFGGTVRLAQSIGLHRDPCQLNPPVSAKEVDVRKNLWWWMLHMDQQYSMTLGRPLGIFSIGDCPMPNPIIPDPVIQSLTTYVAQFSVLGRQILAAGYLSIEDIDRFTDGLLSLHRTLPMVMRFDASWLNKDRSIPGWPLDAQAGLLHSKMHNLLILLNRRRIENIRRHSVGPSSGLSVNHPANDLTREVLGRERVLYSCRAILLAFDFFHIRVRAALICWTMGQMAFNAAMLLTMSMLETGETQDLLAVQHAYSIFLEMNKLGIHKLAGAAVERLGTLMKEFRTEDSSSETVMGQYGMMLLEDVKLQGTGSDTFTPIDFEPSNIPTIPRVSTGLKQSAEQTKPPKKKINRKSSTRDTTNKAPKVTKKPSSKTQQRPLAESNHRRFSDSVTPRPQQKRRTNRSTPSLTLLTAHPGQNMFSASSTPVVKSETLLSTASAFDNFPTTFNSPLASAIDFSLNLDDLSQSQQVYMQHHHHSLGQQHQRQHQHAISDPGDHTFPFSDQTTPYSTEFFDDPLHHALNTPVLTPFEQQPFSGVGQFSVPGDMPGSYSTQY